MSDVTTNSTLESPATAASNAIELVSSAAREGAADARQAAAHAWEVSSRFVSRFVYTTCYTVSYGVVFPAAFIAQAVPKDNAAVRGLIDGASAAKAKVASLGTSCDPVAIPAIA